MLYSINFFAPIVLISLFAGIFGFKAGPIAFKYNCIFGITAFLAWDLCEMQSYTGLAALAPSVLASAIGFFGSHYLLEKSQK
ncbi:MAG: hypothetical protein COC15_04195 [Legionellales bacterium]|nr:MAG: hypothetical protein COC15_04195 [Legionellales bacterium]